jgi:hypothetical protein
MPWSKQRAVLLLDLARALGPGHQAQELTIQARRIGEELHSQKVLAAVA